MRNSESPNTKLLGLSEGNNKHDVSGHPNGGYSVRDRSGFSCDRSDRCKFGEQFLDLLLLMRMGQVGLRHAPHSYIRQSRTEILRMP